jgi:23S rRNA U2552 (ribose-2'-O)-methylase RlmE/FtsJ
VDLLKVSPVPGCTILQGDIKEYLSEDRFDVVLCDAAQDLGEDRVENHKDILELNRWAVALGVALLKDQGTLVFKCYQGPHIQSLKSLLK